MNPEYHYLAAMPRTTTLLMPAGVDHLECGFCGAVYPDPEQPWRLSPCCTRPLLARYDLAPLRGRFTPAALVGRPPTMWRYAEALPVRDDAFRV
ncbi:MAG TPA: hypothetical protein VK966_13670, partial [Longimicrobiales bacterium]|nr:hypothetical protein [Longimicrobiales bacterium]